MLPDQAQHLVPETYLKQFTSGDRFFQLSVNFRHVKGGSVHPEQVCYETNYYDVHNQIMLKRHGIEGDPRFIENNAFYYEPVLVDILNKIKINRMPFLRQEDTRLLVYAYLSIKQRNPFYMRKMEDKEWTRKLYDETAKKLKSEFETMPLIQLLFEHHNFNFDSFAEKFKNDSLHESRLPILQRETQLSGIIDGAQGKSKTFLDVAQKLFRMNITVIEASDRDYFIVSDNPGYSLKALPDGKSDGVYNLELAIAEKVFFPINSKQALFFYGNDPLAEIRPLKHISYLRLPSEAIYEYNKAGLLCTNGFVFCEDLDYLRSFNKRVIRE